MNSVWFSLPPSSGMASVPEPARSFLADSVPIPYAEQIAALLARLSERANHEIEVILTRQERTALVEIFAYDSHLRSTRGLESLLRTLPGDAWGSHQGSLGTVLWVEAPLL